MRPTVPLGRKELLARELRPFQQLAAAAPSVMVSHAAFAGVSGGDRPASLCPEVVTGLLRDELRPDLLAAQVYEGFQAAAERCARGELDAEGFRSKALYALHVCLLAACREDVRGEIVESLRALEPQVAALPERAA